jgi:arylsulfatase
MVLKTCQGEVCTQPWNSLHTDKSVKSLRQALDDRFDEFYSKQPQMWYSECALGYLAHTENQSPVHRFAEQPLPKQGATWRDYWGSVASKLNALPGIGDL